MHKLAFIFAIGCFCVCLLGCERPGASEAPPVAATPVETASPNGPASLVAADEAVEVTVKELVDHTQDYGGRTVILTGKIIVECGQGCWFFLKDDTGQIYVDLKPAGITIPQKIGAQATVRGKIKGSGGNLQLLGEEVIFP